MLRRCKVLCVGLSPKEKRLVGIRKFEELQDRFRLVTNDTNCVVDLMSGVHAGFTCGVVAALNRLTKRRSSVLQHEPTPQEAEEEYIERTAREELGMPPEAGVVAFTSGLPPLVIAVNPSPPHPYVAGATHARGTIFERRALTSLSAVLKKAAGDVVGVDPTSSIYLPQLVLHSGTLGKYTEGFPIGYQLNAQSMMALRVATQIFEDCIARSTAVNPKLAMAKDVDSVVPTRLKRFTFVTAMHTGSSHRHLLAAARACFNKVDMVHLDVKTAPTEGDRAGRDKENRDAPPQRSREFLVCRGPKLRRVPHLARRGDSILRFDVKKENFCLPPSKKKNALPDERVFYCAGCFQHVSSPCNLCESLIKERDRSL